MARFYESRNIDDSQAQYRIVVRTPDGKRTEINLPRQVFEGIEELQREFWRTERRETRHSLHLASMDEASLAPNNPEKDPELIFMEKLESEALFQAFQQIPAAQRRRFLMRHLLGMPAAKIAEVERCSDRAVRRSISLARENLKEILSSGF